MSVLKPETVAILKTAKASGPMFSNMILAELFDYRHTLGDLKLLPRTCGGFVVYDHEKRVAVEIVEGTEAAAHKVLERHAAERAAARAPAVAAPPVEAKEPAANGPADVGFTAGAPPALP